MEEINLNSRKICKLWHCTYPWDVRVEKICRSLVKNNYAVHLICKGRRDLPMIDELQGINIFRIFSFPKFKFAKILNYPLFFNPIWVLKIYQLLRNIKPSLLIVRDLPLSLTCGLIGHYVGFPVVLDMAENYPAALLAYENPYYKPFLLGDALLPKKYEIAALRYIDHIIVVAEEQKVRLQRLGFDETKITIVKNTPDLKYYYQDLNSNKQINLPSSRFKYLLYTGKIDRHRGVDCLIKSLPLVLRKFNNIKLILAGDGTELENLRGLANRLKISNNLIFLGWINLQKIFLYISLSHICIIPHLKSVHTDTTIPNKIFDYMAFGKPIISSDLNPLKKIIFEEKCGLIFESGNHIDLSEKIIAMMELKDVEEIGLRGKEAVERKYNWSNDERNLLEAIDKVLA